MREGHPFDLMIDELQAFGALGKPKGLRPVSAVWMCWIERSGFRRLERGRKLRFHCTSCLCTWIVLVWTSPYTD